MKIVIKDGYQYLDIGNGRYSLITDDYGDPVPACAREWVETEAEFVLYPKVKESKIH